MNDRGIALLAKLRAGKNVDTTDLPQPLDSLAAAMLAVPPACVDQRYQALITAANALPNGQGDKIVEAILEVDPDNPLPANPYRTKWTATELLSADFPAPKWAAPNSVPVGLTILAGRPKLGKSWLALQLAIAKAAGGVFLGERPEPGKVLFIALEDNGRRLQERLKKQQAKPTDALTFELEWAPLAGSGIADLQKAIDLNGYSLVIIDTLSRALGQSDQLDLSIMTTVVGQLQHIALGNEVAILCVDHHRKNNGYQSSPIDDILGSTGKAAVADAAMGLYREQGKQGATLKITGRDLEDRELALNWDPDCCCWQMQGDAGQVREDTLKGEVIRAIKALAADNELSTTARIAQYLGLGRGGQPNVSHTLGDLINAGKVRKGPKQGREVPYEVIQQ